MDSGYKNGLSCINLLINARFHQLNCAGDIYLQYVCFLASSGSRSVGYYFSPAELVPPNPSV